MDFIFDFIVETVFDGAFGSFADNSLPKSAKIAITTVCNLIVAGLCSMGLYLANKAEDKIGVIIFSVFIALDIVVYCLLVWCIIRKNKGRKRN